MSPSPSGDRKMPWKGKRDNGGVRRASIRQSRSDEVGKAPSGEANM